MITRRTARAKVLQLVYAHESGMGLSEPAIRKKLQSHIDSSETLYYVFLVHLLEIAQYNVIDVARRAAKYIPTEEDEAVDSRLAEMELIKAIAQDATLKEAIETYQCYNYVDNKRVRDLYRRCLGSEPYEALKPGNLDTEKRMAVYILKKIIGSDEVLDDNLAEHFIQYEADHFILLQTLSKKIQALKSVNSIEGIHISLAQQEENTNFALQLLSYVIEHHDELQSHIDPLLKNWDADRLARTDVLLLRMACAELLHFPFVPVKVTLNEYIDLAKEYSTPKSKDFINGVLDKLSKQLKADGLINKKGRGLLN